MQDLKAPITKVKGIGAKYEELLAKMPGFEQIPMKKIGLIKDCDMWRDLKMGEFKTPMFPKIYDYFTLRISDNLAGYLSLSLVESEFSVDTLNMLLEGGGQAGKMIFTDDNQEFVFSFSCWQDGLILYPGT